MKRSTYILASLTILLTSGVLLAVALSNKAHSQRATLAAAQSSIPAAAPATTVPLPIANSLPLPLEPGTHDPVLIKENDYYYLFYTGGSVLSLRSKDLIHWENPTAQLATVPASAPATATTPAGRGGRGGRGGGQRVASALPGMPASMKAAVPNARDLWAPDIAFFKGKYLLYYAASTFGSRDSAIGLSTNKTLDPASKEYKWEDQGVIVRSQNSDNFNAIDPNFVVDENGKPWLTFGSFWTGIKLRKLTEEGKPDPVDTKLYSIAARSQGTAIEAPFIIREGKYFYLFVSWDKCCVGLNSTYRIMVGRSEKITGPYVDKENVDMAKGGGTQLLAGDGKRIIGPGHEGLFKDGDHWLMVHHFYDGNTNGTSRLQVRPVTFDEKQWPVLGKAMNSPG